MPLTAHKEGIWKKIECECEKSWIFCTFSMWFSWTMVNAFHQNGRACYVPRTAYRSNLFSCLSFDTHLFIALCIDVWSNGAQHSNALKMMCSTEVSSWDTRRHTRNARLSTVFVFGLLLVLHFICSVAESIFCQHRVALFSFYVFSVWHFIWFLMKSGNRKWVVANEKCVRVFFSLLFDWMYTKITCIQPEHISVYGMMGTMARWMPIKNEWEQTWRKNDRNKNTPYLQTPCTGDEMCSRHIYLIANMFSQ